MKPLHYSKLLIFASALMFSSAKAQNLDSKPTFKSRFKLDFTVGPNFDFTSRTDTKNPAIFGSRPAVSPFLGVRATHLFSSRFGWYAGINVNYYKEIKPTGYKQSIIESFFEDFGNAFLGPISYVKPSVEIGALYRIEYGNWSIYPSLGIGYDTYLADKDSYKWKKTGYDPKEELTYERNSSFLTTHIGLSTNYQLSRKTYLALNARYHHPLQAATAHLIETTDGVETSRFDFRSKGIGRGVFLGVGFGVLLGKI